MLMPEACFALKLYGIDAYPPLEVPDKQLTQNCSVGKIHCTIDKWTRKLGSAWKAIMVVMLEEGKDLLTSFVLDYIW